MDDHKTRHSAYTENFDGLRDQTNTEIQENMEYMEAKWTSKQLKVAWRRVMLRKYREEARKRGLLIIKKDPGLGPPERS